MDKLPLFPLNAVVFPGMPIPLHIFEERYKEMITTCVDDQTPFGIVLIKQGAAEADPHVKPHAIGCTVNIKDVEQLPDGRLLIMGVGEQRFRIHTVERYQKPYLIGDVELLHYEHEASSDLETPAEDLYPLLLDYLDGLASAGRIQFEPAQIPSDPERLAYLASSLLDTTMERKQKLLSTNKLSTVLRYLLPVYERQVKLIHLMPKNDQGTISLN
jgi:uncharacterized protein